MTNNYEILVKVGYRVRASRKSLGWTQDELAQKLGVARTTVIAIEAGQRKLKKTELEMLISFGFPDVTNLNIPVATKEDTEQEREWVAVTKDELSLIAAYRRNDLRGIVLIATGQRK